MAPKTILAILLSLNLLFLGMLSSSAAVAPAPRQSSCPMDIQKLSVCADLLHSELKVDPLATHPCCSLFEDMSGVEATSCICAAIRDRILDAIDLQHVYAPGEGVNVMINTCGIKDAPSQCPN